MKKLSYVILLIILFAGCSPVNRIARLTKKHPELIPVKELVKTDTSYIERIELKEVPITLPGDTFIVEVPTDCPDQEILEIENSDLKQRLEIKQGTYHLWTVNKPDTVFIKVPEKITEIKSNNESEIVKPERYVPKLYKISMLVALALLFLIAVYIIIKLKWR